MLTLTTLPSCPQHRQWRVESTCHRQGISRVNGVKLWTTEERTDFNGSNTPKCPKSFYSFRKTACSFHDFDAIFESGQKRKSPANPLVYRTLWRRVRDSNPRDLSVYSISSAVRKSELNGFQQNRMEDRRTPKPQCLRGSFGVFWRQKPATPDVAPDSVF